MKKWMVAVAVFIACILWAASAAWLGGWNFDTRSQEVAFVYCMVTALASVVSGSVTMLVE